MAYYHGTNHTNVEGIMEDGLQTDKCGENFGASHGETESETECPVFLTTGKRRAAFWAQNNPITPPDGSKSPVVLKVKSQCVDKDKLEDDNRPTVRKGDKEYHDNIEPDCISVESPTSLMKSQEKSYRQCAEAYEKVNEKESELKVMRTHEDTFKEYENAIKTFEKKCGMKYHGDDN